MSAADWFEIVGIVLLIGVVALMAASETAINRSNRVRAHHLAEDKRRGAASLVKVVENPPPYLNVVLLLTMLATIGGTAVATDLSVRHLHHVGEIVATVAMTLLLFVFAEVTPKTFAIQQTDRVALRVAPIVVALTRLFGPLARALLKVANVIMPGKGLPQGPYVTEQEIKTLAEVASDEEQIEEEEKELIHSIFEFGDTIVREVMVPRPDIVAVEVSNALRDVQDVVVKRGFSRIPIFREDIDDIVGIVYAKDVLKALHQGREGTSLEQICRAARFVPEVKKCAELLREMQKDKFHIAMVSDEHGSVVGLVTLEDLIEELVGEITDEYDRDEPQVVSVDDGRYRVSGRMPIDELNEVLGEDLPHEEWDTVGGLMMSLLGAIPRQGEKVTFGDLSFTAERVQGRRISLVLIERIPEEERPAQEAGASAGEA
ncbi:MAG TPA: hemolysin family protein [Actinomycetota bacterium]|nr:hemolysin family protein [Actinomycetota bacterium]